MNAVKNRNRIRLRRLWVALLPLLAVACSASRSTVNHAHLFREQSKAKAVDHYLSGALHDFMDRPKQALYEYYKALTYDSSSAQILKAIGRDLYRLEQYERAVDYLRRSLAQNPRDKETLYYLGQAYYKNNDYEHAIDAFEQFYELDPYNPVGHSNLLFLYSRTGATEKLVSLQEFLAEMEGYRGEAAQQLLSLYMRLNRFPEARAVVEKMLERDSTRWEYWVAYGQILEVLQDSTGAVSAYEKAIALNPEEEKALRRLYLFFSRNENWEGLAHSLRRILPRIPPNDRLHYLLAESLFRSGKLTQAREALQPLLAKEEFRSQTLFLLGQIALREENFPEAAARFRELTRLEPHSRQAWELLALLYLQEEQPRTALEVLREALAAIPEDSRLLSLYGNVLHQLNRDDEALKALEKAYALDPRDLTTITTLGIIYDERQQYPELDSLYEAALREYPENPLLLNNYSYSLAERGIRLEEALEMAQKAVAQEPENGAYLDTMGWIYYKMGLYQEALEWIQKAVSVREESAEVIEHLGDVHFKLGHVNEARKYWQQALDRAPDNTLLKAKLERLSGQPTPSGSDQ